MAWLFRAGTFLPAMVLAEAQSFPCIQSTDFCDFVIHRLVSIARGEQQYFDPEGIPTATEGCKSNALMRCCKDLGIASELWDPVFIRQFMAEHSREVWAEHVTTKKKKRLIVRKDVKGLSYPWKETKA